LIAKLPNSSDARSLVLRARLEELWSRSASGLDTEAPQKALMNEIKTWSVTADPAAIGQMIQAVEEYARRKPASVYTLVEIKDKKVKWKSRAAGIDKARLNGLTKSLQESAISARQ